MLEKQPITFNALAIGIIWVFHLSGIVGILYVNSQWFVGATPINLTLSFSLLLLTSRHEKKALIVAVIAFITGMIAEGLGVNYGLIFGHYNYGDALGMKFYGVPWLIGANWSILTLCCGAIATDLTEAFFSRVFICYGILDTHHTHRRYHADIAVCWPEKNERRDGRFRGQLYPVFLSPSVRGAVVMGVDAFHGPEPAADHRLILAMGQHRRINAGDFHGPSYHLIQPP